MRPSVEPAQSLRFKYSKGFGLLAYLIAGIALAGLIGTGVYKVKKWGADEVRAEWATANRKAEEAATVRRVASELIARTSAVELAAAQQKGRDYEARWRKARAEATKPLATCPGTTTEAVAASGSDDPVRMSYRFLLLWNAAWTNQAGQPVFPDPASPEGAGADTPSAVGPGEVLTNHGENAARCSADRRALDGLITQIERLRAGWR